MFECTAWLKIPGGFFYLTVQLINQSSHLLNGSF